MLTWHGCGRSSTAGVPVGCAWKHCDRTHMWDCFQNDSLVRHGAEEFQIPGGIKVLGSLRLSQLPTQQRHGWSSSCCCNERGLSLNHHPHVRVTIKNKLHDQVAFEGNGCVSSSYLQLGASEEAEAGAELPGVHTSRFVSDPRVTPCSSSPSIFRGKQT